MFSELSKIMVNKVIFLGFTGAIALLWIRPWMKASVELCINKFSDAAAKSELS